MSVVQITNGSYLNQEVTGLDVALMMVLLKMPLHFLIIF